MLAETVLFKCCSEPLQRSERLNSTLNIGCPNVTSTKILLAAACNMKAHKLPHKQALRREPGVKHSDGHKTVLQPLTKAITLHLLSIRHMSRAHSIVLYFQQHLLDPYVHTSGLWQLGTLLQQCFGVKMSQIIKSYKIINVFL